MEQSELNTSVFHPVLFFNERKVLLELGRIPHHVFMQGPHPPCLLDYSNRKPSLTEETPVSCSAAQFVKVCRVFVAAGVARHWAERDVQGAEAVLMAARSSTDRDVFENNYDSVGAVMKWFALIRPLLFACIDKRA